MNKNKATIMLSKSITVEERATSFLTSIQRNLQKSILDELTAKKDKLTDEVFSLSDFTLATDMNKGQSAISREEAEKRFRQIIEKEYELELIDLELESKQEIFDKYFKEVKEVPVND